eukprot:Tamp_17415.p1 GENE.Tamp_17415~~Tamp_17415.p1  ORF type:complete len:215 (+),score=30.61 Tamp_17415:441-1085(+)
MRTLHIQVRHLLLFLFLLLPPSSSSSLVLLRLLHPSAPCVHTHTHPISHSLTHSLSLSHTHMHTQHDRAGFYICWGCLVWVPSLYTCHTHYLVHNPYQMGTRLALLLLLMGLAGVYINYEADAQKQEFRRKNGNCQIWGKKAEKIQAQYVTADGEVKKSLLLLSGWWGLSRHFHYIPEWMAAFAWTAPTLYDGNIVGCASLLPRPPTSSSSSFC